jgi:ankyrin repeat protein
MERARRFRSGPLVIVLLVAGVRDLGAQTPQVILAIQSGEQARVRTALEQPGAIHGREADGTTALHWAVRRNDAAIVDLLIDAGADARASNRYGITPLHIAASLGTAPLVERLLKAGADPNTPTPEGETPLMAAARSGVVPAVKALLAAGADVPAKESWRGQDALMWAAAEGHADVVRALIEAGASVQTRSRAGFTPLLFAVREGHVGVARALLDAKADPNDATRDGTAALIVATINGRFETAAALLDYGAKPNPPDVRGSALHVLAWLRTPGWPLSGPPLILSDRMDSLELAKRLLERGADPNIRVAWKELKRGGFDLGMVVNNPPNISVGRNYISLVGATPFYLAAKHSDVALMRLLAAHGADPRLPTSQGVTPLMAAAGLGFWQGESPGPNNGVPESQTLEAVKLAWELSGPIDINATAHFNNVHLEGEGLALLHRLPLNVHEFDGSTPGDMRWAGAAAIHGAAVRGVNAVVQFLVDKGADLTARTKLGWTPLMLTEGMYIGQTEKEVPQTAAYIRKLLDQRGIAAASTAGREP